MGTAGLLTAQIVWWAWDPANAALAHMEVQNPALAWIEWRNRWEFAHLPGFGLQLAGLAALLASVLSRTA